MPQRDLVLVHRVDTDLGRVVSPCQIGRLFEAILDAKPGDLLKPARLTERTAPTERIVDFGAHATLAGQTGITGANA